MPSRDAAKILRQLEKHRNCFDLTRDDLGDDLCKIATDGVQECIDGEHDPDGNRWPELSEKYARQKARTHPGKPMGVRDLLMARPEEVAGKPGTDPATNVATVTYGITDQAREEATWFQEGNPPHQPPRPFWGFTEASIEASKDLLDARFKRMVG